MGLITSLVILGAGAEAAKSLIDKAGSAAANVASAAKGDGKGIVNVKPSRSSSEYYGHDAVEILNELLGCGFETVNLMEDKVLGGFSYKKYGHVSSVTINGKSQFTGLKKVPASSYVVIRYMGFKDGVNPSVYNKVHLISPGVFSIPAKTQEQPVVQQTYIQENNYYGPTYQQVAQRSMPDTQQREVWGEVVDHDRSAQITGGYQGQYEIPAPRTARYCPYCGEPISNAKAMFCAVCGERL